MSYTIFPISLFSMWSFGMSQAPTKHNWKRDVGRKHTSIQENAGDAKRWRKPIFGLRVIAAIALLAEAGIANGTPVTVTADLEDVTNGGGFFAQVTFTDTGTNVVRVKADIAAPINKGLTQGDVLGLWIDIRDEDKLNGLTFSNEDPTAIITASSIDANNVDGVGSNNVNLNGTHQGGFDIGLALGKNGGPDFIQTVEFDMTSVGLEAMLFVDQRVGMRVQSISGDATFAFGTSSSKLIGSGSGSGSGSGISSGINSIGGFSGTQGNGVPEPPAITLMGAGLLCIFFAYRRRWTNEAG